MNGIKFLVMGLALIFAESIVAQSIIRSNLSTLGSQFTNGDFSISQTAGQSSNTSVVYNHKMAFRQGFQQPVKANSSSRDNELISYTLYPNPNNGVFTLEIEMLKNEEFDFEIINILGSKLYSDKGYSSVKKEINVSHLSGGVYILRIIENNFSLGEIKFVIY